MKKSITELMPNIFESQKMGFACFIDFQKSFDTIEPSLLLKKLRNLGLRGKLCTLVASFLSDRKQFVVHGSKESKKCRCSIRINFGPVVVSFVNQ